MTRTFTLLLFILSHSVFAQKYPKCSYTYFKGGKIATSQCFDPDNRWGQARAFNKAGEVIYEKELRHIAGHSSVTFSFFENGGVRKAEWSSAPDAGIQWYHTTTWFSEDGKVEKEDHNNWDDHHVTVPPGRQLPPTTKTPRPAPTKTETMECAAIWVSECWITNTAPYSVIVSASRKGGKMIETHTITLRPRQSMKIVEMPGAQMFNEPSAFYELTAKSVKSPASRKLIVLPSSRLPENNSPTVRRYYYDIKRII
ncbi:MAG: hypothetical protein KF744_11885 [Taibaiella sp.]|nr:hypothetical protein [Taibaiella sp.]